MHDDLKLLLSVSNRLQGPAEKRFQALTETQATVDRFQRLPRDQQLETLAAVLQDVARLERRASEATSEYKDAREWARVFEMLAHNGSELAPIADKFEELHEAVREAPDGTDATFVLFRQQPQREWRPLEVRDALVAAGRHATKAMVETAIGRLTRRGLIERTSRAKYRLAGRVGVAGEG